MNAKLNAAYAAIDTATEARAAADAFMDEVAAFSRRVGALSMALEAGETLSADDMWFMVDTASAACGRLAYAKQGAALAFQAGIAAMRAMDEAFARVAAAEKALIEAEQAADAAEKAAARRAKKAA